MPHRSTPCVSASLRRHARGPGANRCLLSRRVGDGEVAPACGGGPAHDTGAGLIKLPAVGLFTSVMVPAERGQVALARWAALVVGPRMVQVAACGRAAAAGRGAGGSPGHDEVLEVAARVVTRLLMAMVAATAGQRADR